ncbi:hypothetical protein IEQ34_026438 [Dendrobium chrysotoxum]|uniref:Uncharacterized protein n=1 Tax=Dendrobium chrysotoxum TaxID=161865 RepID=A0AAV7FLI9_DENCH|nr:hypothetical protein IEQ34_026438 [Dendrobium chrysotoxum]
MAQRIRREGERVGRGHENSAWENYYVRNILSTSLGARCIRSAGDGARKDHNQQAMIFGETVLGRRQMSEGP